MTKHPEKLPRGVVAGPVAAIGSLALALSAGFGVLGVLDGMNADAARWVAGWGLAGTMRPVPPWIVWISTTLLAYGIAAAILLTPGLVRRLMIWASSLVLLFCWVPVLALAAWHFPVFAPLVCAFWSGASSLVYTLRHQMPCDPHKHQRHHPKHHL